MTSTALVATTNQPRHVTCVYVQLAQYFYLEEIAVKSLSPFVANMYLAGEWRYEPAVRTDRALASRSHCRRATVRASTAPSARASAGSHGSDAGGAAGSHGSSSTADQLIVCASSSIFLAAMEMALTHPL
jgi:hypothetical protein